MTLKAKASPKAPRPAPKPEGEVAEVDTGPERGQPRRRCIVTRRVAPPDELIRFVLAPDGAVVPDLKRRLPGRGAWVTAERWAVDKAARRNAFARALKAPARPSPGLADEVGERLKESALGALGLERRAGRLAVGFAEVDALLRRGRADVVLHAAEAATDGRRKLDQAAHAGGRRVAVCRAFTAAELGLALGRENVIHAAIEQGRGSEGAARRCLAYEHYLAEAGQVLGRN
jgi:uncharacterized protein